MQKELTKKQIDFAQTLAYRFGMNIPHGVLSDYEFGKQFIDLFAWDPDNGQTTGLKRVETIIDYLYYDKEQRHLQFKLNLDVEQVAFMVAVLRKYKFPNGIPRENLLDKDPEATAYEQLEKEACGEVYGD